MSFNRLNYDNCSYKQEISESVAPGAYMLDTPQISCVDCFPVDPQLIMQRAGNSVAKNMPMIDVDSELLNLNRKLSSCSQKEFLPKFDKEGNIDNSIDHVHFNNCEIPTRENTRLSNPACNLRGTGINRFEWLCNDPQERVLIPFDNNVSNRLVVKDNHRPLIPTPLDQSVFLPKGGDLPVNNNIVKTPSVPVTFSGVNLQSSDVLREL